METELLAGTDELYALLSNGTRLAIDRVVFASGYRADLAKVPYLAQLIDRIAVRDGFPVLDEGFQTSVEGLYVSGSPRPTTSDRSLVSSKACRPLRP